MAAPMIKIKATFIGTDSLGYHHGQQYNLTLFQEDKGVITIHRENGSGYCPYDNFVKFLENWSHIITKSIKL